MSGNFAVTEPLVDVAQFRREVGTLTEQGVAANTIILLPDEYAPGYLRFYGAPIITIGEGFGGVEGKYRKQQHEKYGTTITNITRHGLGEDPGCRISPYLNCRSGC